MLNKHLIVKTQPLADPKNIVHWKKYRVSVLSDRLFRIERSENRRFRDDATQSVWYRDMPAQNFKTTVGDRAAIIETTSCKLILKDSREDCRICLNGGAEQKIDNEGNLLGTSRTLDCCNGNKVIGFPWSKAPSDEYDEVKLENGVCSNLGVAVIDDSNSLSLAENGEVIPKKGDGSDEYVFAFGSDYKAAVRALYTITGKTPLIPRFALGNWWSRYHDYTDREYLRLLEKFEDNDIPLTVATIDMDWHYSKNMEADLHIEELGRNTPFYGGNNGWTGYSWNKNLFPDHKAFLKKIKEKNLKITLNLHPAEGVRWFEDSYEDMANALGKDAKTGERIPFDIANPDFINAYFEVLHKPYEKDGVAFWWIDWQQGVESGMEGLDPLWSLNHYHYLDNAVNHKTPLILSRYAGVGSHRYPLGFSGDTLITWDTLAYLPYFTATASNIGYTWWSHDIGGHMFGVVSGELYVRHIQFGVFSPINRLHSSDAAVTTKEPWFYGNGTGKIAMQWLRLRHKLIPFLYTLSYKTHEEGRALVEPLYYQWDTLQAYRMQSEYLFGEQLLVAPITEPMKNGYAKTKIWLPKGQWTDIFTGDEYEVRQAKTFTIQRDLESIPVLAKAGAILPLSADKGNSCKNPTKIDIWAFNGDGAFTLYEDGREEEKNGEFYTHFKSRYQERGDTCIQTLTITSNGDKSVIPQSRTFTVYFKNIEDGVPSFTVNGKEVTAPEKLSDHIAVTFDFKAGEEYAVSVAFQRKTELEKLLVRAKRILLGAEGDNERKALAYARLLESKDVAAYKRQVQLCYMDEEVKARLLEIL